MRAVVGLGNPGSRYAATRHNLGVCVVGELARRWRLTLGPVIEGNRIAHGCMDTEAILLVEPQMYMNRSGEALARLQPPVDAGQLIAVHDDLDLECGRVRVKRGGGAGGHRGIESIAESYGPDFPRVRIGIGRPPLGGDVAEYVLSAFTEAERQPIEGAIARAADAVECILRHGVEIAMNRFNAFNARNDSAPPMTAEVLGRN